MLNEKNRLVLDSIDITLKDVLLQESLVINLGVDFDAAAYFVPGCNFTPPQPGTDLWPLILPFSFIGDVDLATSLPFSRFTTQYKIEIPFAVQGANGTNEVTITVQCKHFN